MEPAAIFETEPAEQGQQSSKVYTLGELFAGAGGMALGAHWAKYADTSFKHLWMNDFDDDACKTFEHNFGQLGCKVYCCDVKRLDFKSLSPIDGLVFGFPCNDFSIVGERQGISGSFGGLYVWGVEGLKALRPSFFVAENVGGLSSSGKKKDFQKILAAFEDAGYDIYPHHYKFEEYGVPQSRHRIIIVGFRSDLAVQFVHPSPKTGTKIKTCKEALQGIPKDAFNHEYTAQSKTVVERLSYIKPGQNAFDADIPRSLQLKMKSGARISQIYKRLRPDAPSYTVTGSGGGGTHIYHWKENRSLTNRERARLQTFPDQFRFLGGKESVRKQIGMAVPPVGAKIIFSAILKTFAETDVAPAMGCHHANRRVV